MSAYIEHAIGQIIGKIGQMNVAHTTLATMKITINKTIITNTTDTRDNLCTLSLRCYEDVKVTITLLTQIVV